jgi:hypothetical protein
MVRDQHGFLNPCGSRVRVTAGTGTGQHHVTRQPATDPSRPVNASTPNCDHRLKTFKIHKTTRPRHATPLQHTSKPVPPFASPTPTSSRTPKRTPRSSPEPQHQLPENDEDDPAVRFPIPVRTFDRAHRPSTYQWRRWRRRRRRLRCVGDERASTTRAP